MMRSEGTEEGGGATRHNATELRRRYLLFKIRDEPCRAFSSARKYKRPRQPGRLVPLVQKATRSMDRYPGNPYPLGATPDGEGVNFALYSEHAEAVDLCLVDADGHETRVPLRDRTAFVWHVYLPGVKPGQF
jgi:hypothetical protein